MYSIHSAPTDGQRRSSNVAVIGCGHVGVVTAACLAGLGHRVVGVDVQEHLVQGLRSAQPPFLEPGLPELIQDGIAAGTLAFTTSYEAALSNVEFIFLAVNTPATSTGAADLRYIRQAVARIGHIVKGTRPITVTKSTLPVGTIETIETVLRRSAADDTIPPRVVANPEFLTQGNAVFDFLHPHRIVIGAASLEDAQEVCSLYHSIDAPVVLTDLCTAEMIKYVSNCFLATKVSFINEIARLCECVGADIDTVVKGVSLDPRIGSAFLRAGIGYGGSCFPKDVAALCHTGESAGVPIHLLPAVQLVNLNQRKHTLACIRRMLGTLEGAVVGVWGLTYKGGTEDLRESPALDVVALLRNEGALVQAYDPTLHNGHAEAIADRLCPTALEAARGAAILAVLTDWPEFAEVDLRSVASVMAGRLVFDGRNILRRADVEAAGLAYRGIGRAFTSDSVLVEAAR
jgi:UDPglucose 6-dehydrogenase